MQHFQITPCDALKIVLKYYSTQWREPEYHINEGMSHEQFEEREKKCEPKGQGVYVFIDYCSVDNPYVRPSDGSQNYAVIRNIGETNRNFYGRFKYKKFTWNEVILIRMEKFIYTRRVKHGVNPQARSLQNFLLERIRCTNNKHYQYSSKSDVFVTSLMLPTEERKLHVEKYAPTFEHVSNCRP